MITERVASHSPFIEFYISHNFHPFRRGKSPSHAASKIRIKFIVHFVSRFPSFERKSMGDAVTQA
jgi:hypothetical protein